MKRSVMILLMGLFCMSNMSYAGNGDLTVGGTLEMTSSANGFLPPRMTTSARGNLTPSPGMLIYNTDDNAYNYYTSSGWKSLAVSLPVHDNTGASSDYALAVGETTKITYTSATSVPLHINVLGTEYEIIIQGSRITPVNNGPILLNPNNITYTNAIRMIKVYCAYGSNPNSYSLMQSAFQIGEGAVVKSKVFITTSTGSKSVVSRYNTIDSGPSYYWMDNDCTWEDITTSWTSLGTLVFPFAQSGTIIIRRIL